MVVSGGRGEGCPPGDRDHEEGRLVPAGEGDSWRPGSLTEKTARPS